jgi:putative ABC transport system permease protein
MRTLFKDIRRRLWMLLQSSAVTVVAVLVAVLGIGANTKPDPVSPANHSNWKSRNQVFGDITAAVDLARVNLTGAGEPEELFAGEVTANFFQMIGVEPVLGRSFSPEEDKRGHDRVAILSHGLWRRRFASDTGMIGRRIVLNGESHQVIGILPRDFSWNNRRTDVWVPYLLDSNRDERIAGERYMRVASGRNQNGRARSSEI